MGMTPTGQRLFFQLLHTARGIGCWNHGARHLYLLAMMQVMNDNREDFTIADNMRGYWQCQQSGAD